MSDLFDRDCRKTAIFVGETVHRHCNPFDHGLLGLFFYAGGFWRRGSCRSIARRVNICHCRCFVISPSLHFRFFLAGGPKFSSPEGEKRLRVLYRFLRCSFVLPICVSELDYSSKSTADGDEPKNRGCPPIGEAHPIQNRCARRLPAFKDYQVTYQTPKCCELATPPVLLLHGCAVCGCL